MLRSKEHVERVAALLEDFAEVLRERAESHDKSLGESPERELFERGYEVLENAEEGTGLYFDATQLISAGMEHHFLRNSHHPEHYPNGIYGMDLVDVVEMFCVWLAADEVEDQSISYDLGLELALVLSNTRASFRNNGRFSNRP